MPKGFGQPGKVLKLKKSLHGQCDAPRNWFNHLKSDLEVIGFEQAIDADLCLFLFEKVICLVYVDNCIMIAKETTDINSIIAQL